MYRFIAAFCVVALAAAAAGPAQSRGRAPIVVDTTNELRDALVEAEAGQRILVRAGTYAVDGPLAVPDGVTLEGEGVMLGGGLPTRFKPGTETTIVALSTLEGDLLTLGDNTVVRRLLLQDTRDRVGNVVAVLSRGPDSSVSASIVECEIVNPDPLDQAGVDGPTGGGVVALTRNPARGDPPAPDTGATVNVQIERSIVRAPGRALFAMNFAPNGRVEVGLTENVVEGTLEAIGGLSRPDRVSGATTTIHSRSNLYTPPAPSGFGWMIGGGSSPPFAIAGGQETSSNHLDVDSADDRIEGALVAIDAFAGRRRSDTAGLSSDNTAELQLRDLDIQTTGADAADLRLRAAESSGEFLPGHRNTLSVDIRDSTGSGPRANLYRHVFGPLLPENRGEGNRLEFVGTLAAFQESNAGIDPAPPASFFATQS